jgi:protein disulfide-isomerase-like protein
MPLSALIAALLTVHEFQRMGPEPVVEDHVNKLTTENFDQFIKMNPLVIIKFYAPWCAHCKALAPIWSAAAQRAQTEEIGANTSVPFAKLDIDSDTGIPARYGINAYPTIKVFRNGNMEAYTGTRDEDGIVANVKALASYRPPMQLITTPDLVSLAAMSEHRIVVGLFREPTSASAAFAIFVSVAMQLAGQPITFAYSTAQNMPLVAGQQPAVPGLLMISEHGQEAIASLPVPRKKEEFTPKAIVTWLCAHGLNVRLPKESPSGPPIEHTEPEGWDQNDDAE